MPRDGAMVREGLMYFRSCKLAVFTTVSILTFAVLVVLYTKSALASRAIPDDNLAYPVRVTLKNGDGQILGYGSGFYLNTDNATYFVTAKHVVSLGLMDPKTSKIAVPDLKLELLSYTKDMPTPKRNLLNLDFSILRENGDVKVHPVHDVALIKIDTVVRNSGNQPSTEATKGVTAIELGGGLLGVSMQGVRTYDQTLVGNDAILYGYPTSLGLPDIPQFDPLRPLLRRGLVAGQNPQYRLIIIDGAVYPGNSGGPVFEIDSDGFRTNFVLIGVLIQFIPSNNDAKFNSGYSVAEPMDFVLELIN